MEYQNIGNLTGNLVICKFETNNSTRRTILFCYSCHVCIYYAVPLSIVKINAHSEWEVASWNIKRMKMYKTQGLNYHPLQTYHKLFLLLLTQQL